MTTNSATATANKGGESIRFIPVQSTLYPWLVTVFVVVFLISNINATKGVQLGPLVTDGAFFLFPLAYIVGDVLAECYGFRSTRRAVIMGFSMALLTVICFYIAIWLPAASFYEGQDAFSATLGMVPQIVAASLVGYLVGQLLNAWTLVMMKQRAGEHALKRRLILSTIAGEFGDTLLFCTIAAPVIGISTAADFINFVLVGFLWKTGIEVVLLPITTRVIAWVKNREDYRAVGADFHA
ncbi:MAG: queuosine precursor transporter [Corynebacterium sp.]|nr:queuosine precursor transporter [Corynebacterium sp.]